MQNQPMSHISFVTVNELNSEATKQLHKINCSIEKKGIERGVDGRPQIA